MLQIDNISFSYRDKPTLTDVSFKVKKGQTVALIGESGCGKSTILKLIYGMYDLDSGSISYNGLPILGPRFNLIPGEDYIKYLAQDFDLMPYISVAENVGRFLSNTNKIMKQARINELLALVEMEVFSKIKAQYLSGGQMQRVAIAMVLAHEPEILLLDEPFSHIDNFRRGSLSRKLFAYLSQKQISCIVATHDSADVFSFADQVVIIRDGKVVDTGNPKTLHDHPKNKYSASLFGDVNEIPARYFKPDSEGTLLIYPYQLYIAPHSRLMVTVKKSYYRGHYYLIEAIYEHGVIYFENETALSKERITFLEMNSKA